MRRIGAYVDIMDCRAIHYGIYENISSFGNRAPNGISMTLSMVEWRLSIMLCEAVSLT